MYFACVDPSAQRSRNNVIGVQTALSQGGVPHRSAPGLGLVTPAGVGLSPSANWASWMPPVPVPPPLALFSQQTAYPAAAVGLVAVPQCLSFGTVQPQGGFTAQQVQVPADNKAHVDMDVDEDVEKDSKSRSVVSSYAGFTCCFL